MNSSAFGISEHPLGPVGDELSRLTTPQAEAHAFWRLRMRLARSALVQAITHSRLRLSLVVFLSLFFWFGLYLLFAQGFRFLEMSIGHAGTHAEAVQALYNVFFASLMLMLICSAAIILYSGVFCSAEAAFLLTTPARPERIVLHKFQEAIFFSSWGFLLLGSPMLVAYGVEMQAPWYYFAFIVPMMLSFVYIPGAVGAILCLVIVERIPRLRFHRWAAVTLTIAAFLLLFGWSLFAATENNILTPLWFQEVLSRLQVSEYRLLPSWWLSSGLLEAARNDPGTIDYQPWAESLKFLALLVSNALLCHIAVLGMASRMYRIGYSERMSGQSARKPKRLFWLDALVLRWLPLLSPQMRLLIAKDSRLFRRDPVQWSQFLIFFGLLALYFVNIRRFSYDPNYVAWVNMISFLNLAVVGLILSTFTTRFIYPMVSLEGRRIWILGLLPVRRELILWGKFWFAVAGSSVPCMLLILLSDLMLQVSLMILVIHQAICLLLCLGLSGIAVGLGAAMPDLREQSPSKIAAGFGGTLNLVLSAGYIVLIVLMTALPCHFYLAASPEYQMSCLQWLVLGSGASLALGLAATLLPMQAGLRAFRSLEF